MSRTPLVTVIMPVRNEGEIIRESLGAVLAQDYPREKTEIIVVDGMSTDGTRAVVAGLQSGDPRITLIDNPRKIVPSAMNLGFARARGEIIVRVDGHCRIAPDYVRRCVDHLLAGRVDGVGGPVRTIGETGVARTIALAMSSPFGVGGSAFRTVNDRTMLADTVPFPAYTRSIMERAGPYDEEQVRNQDDEYNYRLRKLGAKILLAADVRSDYYSRSSIRSLWRQYYQYGYWKVRVLQKHPRQMKLRQFVPASFVAALLAAAVSVPFAAQGAAALAAVAGAYCAAAIAAAVLTARREKMSMAPLLALAFATLHLSYGLGFLVGMIAFARMWGHSRPPHTISQLSGTP
ncbi:MAG TPA: glycosyltransferase family 2 protein [Bacteroidota bacterium]|nr:glycosyltransferase family 2 protein [Bacteroidota bacterium]